MSGLPGTYWAWGEFNVANQPSTVFQLPGSLQQCNTACPGFLDNTPAARQLKSALRRAMPAVRDPLINLARSIDPAARELRKRYERAVERVAGLLGLDGG